MPAPNVFAPNSANCADSAMPVTPAAVAKAAPLIETVDVPETETEAEEWDWEATLVQRCQSSFKIINWLSLNVLIEKLYDICRNFVVDVTMLCRSLTKFE